MRNNTVLWIIGGVLVVRWMMRDVYVEAFDAALDNITDQKRSVASPARIMRVGAPHARVVRHIADATNADIVQLCTMAVNDPTIRVKWDDHFDRDDAPLLAWETLRSLRYIADEDSQVVKAPRVLLNEGTGDCKSFAVFAATMMRAAGWDAWLRFVKNEPGPMFGHVYAIGEKGGRTCAVDGVLDQFDVEPLHFGAIDVRLP